MHFEPGTLVLFTTDSIDSIRSILQEQSIDKRQSVEPIQIRSRLIHERDHLFRHLSSSYGMVRFGLHSLLVRQFYGMMSHYNSKDPVNPHGLIVTPLRELLAKSHPPRVIQELSRVERIRPSMMYLSGVECIRALDGDPPFLDRDLAPSALVLWGSIALMLNAQSASPSVFDPSATPPPELTRFINSNDPLVPIVKGQPIGANQLLEFFAIMMEFSYLSNQGLEIIDSSDLIGMEAYFRIGTVFFGQFFQKEMTNGQFPAFPVELEAAVDLALAMPLTPQGLHAMGRKLSWFDLHPGWRFLRICAYYQQSNRQWTRIKPDDNAFQEYDEAVLGIQEEVCRALVWPTASQLDGTWHAFVTERLNAASSHPFALDLGGSGRLRIAKHLLEERLLQPYSMYLKRRSGIVDRELFFPAIISQEGMTAFEGSHWKGSDGQPTNWNEYLFFTACRFFAEGYERHPHFRLDCAKGGAEMLSRFAAAFGADQLPVEDWLAAYLGLKEYSEFEAFQS